MTRFMKPSPVLSVLLSGVLSVAVGCVDSSTKPVGPESKSAASATTPTTDQDPHEVPLTEQEIAQLEADTAEYGAAIKHIQSFRDTIRTETTGGTPAKAHRALDKLDLVLERLTEIARDSRIPKSQWETINTTAQELRDQFNKVHANIDDGKAPNYESVEDAIDKGVSVLAGIPATAPE